MAEEKIGEMYFELKADATALRAELNALKAEVGKKAPEIEKQLTFQAKFDTAIAKLRLSELQKLREKLQREFANKIAMDVNSVSLDRTREKIAAVDARLGGLGETVLSTGNKFGRFSLAITGVNQTFELIKNSFSQLKEVFAQSVLAASQLEVLKENFKGTTEDLELFKKATAGTVSEANLIKLSNQATDLGLSLEQQAILFSLAEDAADKYGTTVEDGFAKIVMASEGNQRGIKALGIETKKYLERVNELAKAQGDSIGKLDADTQKQIRLQAIIEMSGGTLDKVKNKVKDAKDKYEALSVSVEEGKVKIGQLISSALLPLIDSFDKSGKGAKDFLSIAFGLGSVLFNLIPIISGVVIAKSSMAIASAKNATALAVETTALEANTTALGANATAGVGWAGKLGATLGVGILAAIGVAIGIGTGKLIDYLRYDLPEAVNKASEEAANKIKEKEADIYDKLVESGKRTIIVNGKPVTIKVGLSVEDDKSDYKKAVDELEAEYVKKRKAVNDTMLKNEKEKSAAIIEINKQEKEALKNLDVEYGFAKKDKTVTTKFESQIPSGYTAQQVAEFEKLKFAVKGYTDYALAVIEMRYQQELVDAKGNSQAILKAEENKVLGLAMLNQEKLDDDKKKNDKAFEDAKKVGDKILEETQRNNEKLNEESDKSIKDRQEALKGFYEQSKVLSEDYFKYKVQKIADESAALLEATGNTVIAKQLEVEQLKELEKEYFDWRLKQWQQQAGLMGDITVSAFEGISAAYDSFWQSLGNSDISGAERMAELWDTLKSTALQALGSIIKGYIQSWIQSMVVGDTFKSIELAKGVALGSSLAAAYAPAAAFASTMSFGGAAAAGAVGLASTVALAELLAIPKLAKGGDFIVPSGFNNDSYPILVESGERVQVTPANQVGKQDSSLSDVSRKLDILNKNLIAKNFSPIINNSLDLDGRKITKAVFSVVNKLEKEGRQIGNL